MRWRYRWIGIGVLFLLVGGGVWLSRLEWLPWVLRSALEGFPIDRLRYEKATWEGRTITLYGVSLYRGNWCLGIDSLSLRLRWPPCVYLRKAQLSRQTETHNSVPLADASADPLELLKKVLHHIERLDTLSVSQFILPHGLSGTFLKDGDSLRLTMRYDSMAITLQVQSQHKSYEWEVMPATFSRDNLHFSWEYLKGRLIWRDDTLILSGLARGVLFYQPRIAARRLMYDSVGGVLSVVYRAPHWYVRYVSLSLPLRFTLEAQGSGRDSFELHWNVPLQPFEAYQKAIPEGFFLVLSRARLEGLSALDLRLRYNPLLPDTLDLAVDWRTERFQIVSWPAPNPLMLRETFLYRPWGSQRTILLGSENPNYLTFHQIHPYVLFAILHSEDGGFFYHQGFHKELFLRSLLENWYCKCFRRGAGTITMQLVRNLLLSRQKTLARKIEEICLTALIERFRLLSKERIIELYLNMVEWGPEIYGLTEASHFYFDKNPYDLTLSEAIFLGILLPSPKNYRYFIDDSMQCARKSLEPVFQRVGYFVAKANFVPEDSLRSIGPSQVCLKGPARRLFLPPDSLADE